MIAHVYPRTGLVLVLIGFVALSLTYNLVSPPFENPDEINHAEYAAFIAEHGRVPDLLTDCVRLSFHPPLYHALMATIALATHVTTEDVLTNHRLNPDYESSRVILTHDDPGEWFPYAGRSRFVHVARAVTMLIAAITLLYTYALVYLLMNDGVAALLATATVAAVPQFQYISASVNHDGMAAALAAGFIYYAVLTARVPTLRTGVLAGVMLGAGLLVKSSLTVLAPLPLALWVIDKNRPRARSARAIIISYSVAVAIGGWWYVQMALKWGEMLPLVKIVQNTWVGYHLVRTTPITPVEYLPISKQLFQSFWFLAGLMNIPATPLQYACWVGVSVLGLVGLITMLRTRVQAVLALAAMASIAAVLNFNRYVYAAQGRYLFIILPILGLAVASGFVALAPSRLRSGSCALLITCMTVAAVGCAGRAFAPVYAGITRGERPSRLLAPQLYCRNEYSQVVTSSGGTLRGLRMQGRRVGDGTFNVELRIDTRDNHAQVRTASIPSASLPKDETPVDFQFASLTIAPGEQYRVTLHALDATPVGRAALAYTPTAKPGPLHFDGRPLHGDLDVQEVFE